MDFDSNSTTISHPKGIVSRIVIKAVSDELVELGHRVGVVDK
jgi:hypothetical protein